MAGSDAQVLELAGREVRITSPDKVLFPERGETKLDLVRYYAAVAEPLMRAMGGRPVLMQRFPQGAGGPSFFQKRVPDGAPEWLQTTTVQTVNGTPSRALVAADVAHVAWAVNLACLGFHVWPNRADDPEHADELRLDLDPQPGTGFAEARAAARELKALLDELGIAGFPKTTGNRGLHVYVRLEPRWDSYAVRSAAVAAARELERRRPDILTAAWWKEERGQRIFIDYNQNAPHKTVFGAWSVRARTGAQVSTPVALGGARRRRPRRADARHRPGPPRARRRPVGGDRRRAPSLEPLLALHERDRENGLLDAPWPPVYPKQPDEPPRVAPSRARAPGVSALRYELEVPMAGWALLAAPASPRRRERQHVVDRAPQGPHRRRAPARHAQDEQDRPVALEPDHAPERVGRVGQRACAPIPPASRRPRAGAGTGTASPTDGRPAPRRVASSHSRMSPRPASSSAARSTAAARSTIAPADAANASRAALRRPQPRSSAARKSMPAPVRRTSIAARSAPSSSSEATSMPSREACASSGVKRSSPIRSRRNRGERKRTRSRAPRAVPSSVSASPARTRVSSGAPRRASRASSRLRDPRATRRCAGCCSAATATSTASSSRVRVDRSSASSHAGPPAATGRATGSKPSARAPISAASSAAPSASSAARWRKSSSDERVGIDPRADDVAGRLEAPRLHVARPTAPSSRRRR